MTSWIVAALVCAASLAQQPQGLVNQSTLPPPTSAAPAKETPAPKAQAPADTANVVAEKKQKESAVAEEPKASPAPETDKAASDTKKTSTGQRVAAFWFILPGK